MRPARVFSVLALLAASAPLATLIHCGGGGGVPTPPTSPTGSQSAIAPSASAAGAATDTAPIASGANSALGTTGSAATSGASATGVSAGSAASSIAPPEDPNVACGAVSAPFEQAVRPEIKKCFFDAMKANPKLSGNVKIVVNVGPKGQFQAINVVDAKELGQAAVACMTKATKAVKLDTSPCKDRKIEMQMAFGNAAREKK